MTLPLPTTAIIVLENVWRPAMRELPSGMSSAEADVMGLAIGDQESGYRSRVQYGNGPAHSFWQMEKGGGVRGVLHHPSTTKVAGALCFARGIPANEDAVWSAMATDDILGAAFARLLLWTDGRPLPRVGDEEGAWAYYLSLWRPGKPDHDRWHAAYEAAQHACTD